MKNIYVVLFLFSLFLIGIYFLYSRYKIVMKIYDLTVKTLENSINKNNLSYKNDDLIDDYFKEESITFFPCNLILRRVKSNYAASIYDFSKYEDFNIVMLTDCSPQALEDNDSDTPLITIVENTKVYLMKDGSYIWDYRDS